MESKLYELLKDKLEKIEEVVENNGGMLDDLLVCNKCNNTKMEEGNIFPNISSETTKNL